MATSFRILCVDEEELLREALVLFLENMGLEVKCVVDGEACLAEVRADPKAYDYVLVSGDLQGMTGVEAMRNLREIAPELGVGLTTGFNEAQITAELGPGEVVPFLPKPYSRGRLRRFLLSHLAGIEPAVALALRTKTLEEELVTELSKEFPVERFDKAWDALRTAKRNFGNVVVWEVEDPERDWETLHHLQRDAVPTVILDDNPAHKYLYREVSAVLPCKVTAAELTESIVRAAHGR